MKYWTWDLVGALDSASLPIARHQHIHLFHLPKQSTEEKQKILEKDQTPDKSYRIALAYAHRTQGY